jgi:cytochrome c oxidase subunit 1
MMLMSFLAPGGSSPPAGRRTRRSRRRCRSGSCSSDREQFAGFSSIFTRSTSWSRSSRCALWNSFFRLPLLVWANFSTSLLVVIATTFIAASQFFILLDTALHFHYSTRSLARARTAA